MKNGLNYLDVNALKECLATGGNLDQFASSIYCSRDVVDRYIASMDPEEVAGLKGSAPAQGADLEAIKEQVKAELIEELYDGTAEAPSEEAPAPEEEAGEESSVPEDEG